MKKKYKVKKKGILLLVVIVLLLIFGIKSLFHEKSLFMIDIYNMDISMVKEKLLNYGLNITYNYEYNDSVGKDKVISQSIIKDTKVNDGDSLLITVSKGKLDKEKMKNDNINELGRVPIMMYHGIKNIPNEETSYTGGNVDKDGYTRTSEAFRNDLEFYYENGYRMIKLSDYVNGKIDVSYGYSPIILTFDDGNSNNAKVSGVDANGNIIFDKNSAIGILEEFKKKYNTNVTAIFFVTNALFNQPEYDEKIIKWLVDNGYEVGNHTQGHNNFSDISASKTEEVVGYMYQKLDSIIPGKYSNIIALPYGSPYNKTHENYTHILSGVYKDIKYETIAALRVGWEPEVSPFNKDFDPTFLKRCRAYDNNGLEFDIKMVFKNLEKNKYISDGNIDTIVTSSSNENIIADTEKEVILY